MNPLPSDFYEQPLHQLSEALLGKVLVRRIGDQVLSARIVEVEAYHQDGDAAAHSFNGKTKRNAIMFDDPGFLYVYFIYGVHYCMNVTCEPSGVGAAVLIRGLEPISGVAYMRDARNHPRSDRLLTNGPGKCCQAFGINREQNGAPLINNSELFVAKDDFETSKDQIATSPRIGITKSVELPWRYFLKDNPYVSKPQKTTSK